jgi:uncharacterized ferritin-like protein (DUF455 family)
MSIAREARAAARAALLEPDPARKAALAAALWQRSRQGALSLDLDAPGAAITAPGRPARPALVPPEQLPARKPTSLEGRAALIHALAHIEFSAINLALDAVQRFAGLPGAYYTAWINIAGEEALHFGLLRGHLRGLGCDYGDFPAHGGLWDMAVKTASDPLARMALVPRLFEARGLDVTPGIQNKLRGVGDFKAVAILDIILRDEVGHVRAGNQWFEYLCARRGLEPEAAFQQLLHDYDAPPPRPPFNTAARRAAGLRAVVSDSAV